MIADKVTIEVSIIDTPINMDEVIDFFVNLLVDDILDEVKHKKSIANSDKM